MQMPPISLRLNSRAIGLLFATSLSWTGQSLRAQTPAAATPPPAAQEEAITLSPFEVSTSKDVGYVATSSLAGGRTSMSLKDTASAVSVFTREFLDDIGTEGLVAVSTWGLNMDPTNGSPNNNVQGEQNVTFRGLSTSFPSRNYFLWYVDADSYVTERYEFARGPNGVLFGDGTVGGVQTTWTKRPLFNANKRNVEAKADSWGGWRASLDANVSPNKQVAVRVAGLYQDYKARKDDTANKRRGQFVTVGWRPFEKTEIRVEAENGWGQRSLFGDTSADQASVWDKSTVNTGTGTPSTAGTGVARVATTNYYLLTPGIANLGIQDWGPSYRSTGSGFAMADGVRPGLETLPLVPSRKFNLQPRDSVAVLDYETATMFVDQRLPAGFFLQLAGSMQHTQRTSKNEQLLFSEYRIDVNKVLPTGLPNPKFGVPFADQTIQNLKAQNRVKDLRTLLTWSRRFSLITQTVSLIAGERRETFDSWTRVLHRVNGPSPDQTAAANLVRMRLYYDEPGRYSASPIPQVPGWDLAFQDTAVAHQQKPLDYYQFSSVSQLFKDRLNLVLGARHDNYTNIQQTTAGMPTAAVTKAPQLGAIVPDPSTGQMVPTVGATSSNTYTRTSRNAGGVYYLLPWLGLAGNYSETFGLPNSGVNLLDGSSPGVSRSKGKDFGFRLNLLDGRVFATLNYYDSKQMGSLVSGLRITEINRIWTNLNRPDRANVNYRELQSISGQGFEMEVTANPTRALRLMLNLALPRTSVDSSYPQLRAYLAQNQAVWQAGANNLSNPNRVQIATDLTAIQSDLNNAVTGTRLNGTSNYSANTYATVTLPKDGPFKGVAFGLGANLRGPANVGANAGNAFDYLYSKRYLLAAAHLSYTRRLGRANARFQLNAANLLNDDTLVITGYNTYRPGNLATNPLVTAPSAYRYTDPRKVTLTANYGF